MLNLVLAVCMSLDAGPQISSTTVRIGTRKIAAAVMRIPLAKYKPDVVWPRPGLGATATMELIAKQAGADIAVNGCFFDASVKSSRKNPNQNLLAGGKLAYIGGTGCTIGFHGTAGVRIDRVRFKLLGTNTRPAGARSSWYAYRINHTPQNGNIAGLFDRAYGSSVGGVGMKVKVIDGKVSEITYGEADIPIAGYVLFFGSGEASLQRRFQVGDSLDYRVEIVGGDETFWRQAETGVGGGPKLVSDSRVDLHAEDEGFRNPKILTESHQRTMIGWTPSGDIVVALATCGMRDGAIVMQRLGCKEAMNLDGGASSGLWTRDNGYLHKPGRDLNHLLVFRKR